MNLIQALAQRYTSDPKLAVEALTGRAFWNADTPSGTLDDWASNAADARWFMEGQLSTFDDESLVAAESAFVTLTQEAEEREREERLAYEDRPRLQRVFL